MWQYLCYKILKIDLYITPSHFSNSRKFLCAALVLYLNSLNELSSNKQIQLDSGNDWL